jgi:hypothetical protein
LAGGLGVDPLEDVVDDGVQDARDRGEDTSIQLQLYPITSPLLRHHKRIMLQIPNHTKM